MVQTGHGLNDKNMYAYSLNNPINFSDSNGDFPLLAIPILAGGLEILKVGILAIATAEATCVANTVSSAIKNGIEDNIKKKDNTVYKLVDENNNTKYIGRTKNPAARKANHAKEPVKSVYRFITIMDNLSLPEARGLEQILIVHYNTINNGQNKINGISPNNGKITYYMNAGREKARFVNDRIENEALYWTGK